MIMLSRIVDDEYDRDFRKKTSRIVVGSRERQSVHGLFEIDVFSERLQTALGVGHAVADDFPLVAKDGERDLDILRGPTFGRVEHVRGDSRHHSTNFSSRRFVILRCSSAAMRNSVAASFFIRWRMSASISSALRPVAQT